MKKIKIGKIVLNIGCGEGGEKLERAKKLLEVLVKKKVVITKTSDRTTFGTPKGRPLGCKITLRGKDAEEFLKRALDAVDFKISKKVFDTQGNFSLGIREHINLSGVKYDPEIGIYGMDVCVGLERPGYRVLRKKHPSTIGKQHRIKPAEAEEWVKKNFNVQVE
ncbi:MAG: 50S ribosomal protein L5 [Candidatus Aenigmarchaeota archaeon]|nr:50S ribosomal protein L5 [Candidatus Aenigmarchaeota archaeon]